MNKTRREWIENVISRLSELQDELDNIASDEQDAFDNLPEGIQYSERGDAMTENVSDLEQASSDIEKLVDALNEIIER